jgi:MoaA/NifB/PqqE/SkfB family radical SAM enzyme
MMDEKKASFTAASQLPVKILHHGKLLMSLLYHQKIIPLHLQLNPTNRCNLNCSFCSCSERDKSQELPLESLAEIIDGWILAGGEAVTITGGGEPLLYREINPLIIYLKQNKIDIGLVTNGTLLAKQKKEILSKLTWCRISHTDERPFDETYRRELADVIIDNPNVDWAFSYVLTSKPNYDILAKVVDFANKNYLTHVRVVSDLLAINRIPAMDKVRQELQARNVDDKLVIYQGRKEWTKGAEKCLISLLKPVIAPDGTIHPCCGEMYRKAHPSRNFDADACMGNGIDLPEIISKQKYFDGSSCERCYYSDYNDLLESLLLTKIKHWKFV